MTVASGNQLVECQECHNLYHQDCHKPQVTDKEVNDPRLVWYCARCTRQMKRMVRILLYILASIWWPLSICDFKMKIRTLSILKKINELLSVRIYTVCMDLCRCAEDQSVLYICPPPVTLWPSLVYMSRSEKPQNKILLSAWHCNCRRFIILWNIWYRNPQSLLSC